MSMEQLTREEIANQERALRRHEAEKEAFSRHVNHPMAQFDQFGDMPIWYRNLDAMRIRLGEISKQIDLLTETLDPVLRPKSDLEPKRAPAPSEEPEKEYLIDAPMFRAIDEDAKGRLEHAEAISLMLSRLLSRIPWYTGPAKAHPLGQIVTRGEDIKPFRG